MTNLEKLEADIRGKLPRLQEKKIFDLASQTPKLNDILEWLGLKMRTTYAVTCNGEIIKIFSREEVDSINKYWKLEKPYLKDQSQELIDYLAGLI